ncbi:hypothetical protein OEJ37_06315 [Burkholderia sp. BKH01]|nr:hypothetical protein [Burkholderia sp. BKH01]MCU9952974.1 hypothetical protein [Burkholderia sp. BKH01]
MKAVALIALTCLGDLALGTSIPVTASFYFKPANCTGFLCTTLNPLTQN